MDLDTIEKNINIVNLIKSIPTGLCIYSRKLEHIEFIIWNKYMVEITGYTMKEVNNIGFENILSTPYPIRIFFPNSDTSEENEFEIISKNGDIKTITMNTSNLTTEDGKNNSLAIVKDVTVNKKLEQELKEIELWHEKILELSTDCILIHSNEKYVFVNNNTYKLLGIENPKDIIGHSIYKYVSPNFHDVVKDRVSSQLKSKGSVPIIEETLITASGDPITAEIASCYAPYKGTKCIFTFVRNVTPRKILENQLRKSELMLRHLTENSIDMITISDTNGIIQYGTPSNTDTLGYTLEEFVGMNIFDLVYPDDLIYATTMLAEMNETFQEKTVECSLRCKDGKYKCLEIRGKMLNTYGKFEGFIFSSREISDRKKAEKLERDMNEKSRLLNEANEYERLRTEFFANISHELRTPINVILSSLQLLNLKTDNPNRTNWCQEEYKKYPAIMRQNCYRLIRLINNLIDVTKIDSGYFSLNLINTDIVNVVEDITLSVVDYTQNKGISLIFDTDVEEKVLACDPDKIERIILNLISNAVKFTETGGNILVNITDDNQYLIISVKDTGIGISKDKQKIIFDRFVQVDKSLTRNREGSGIGLSLVKSLVEMHKGKITVHSDLNQGSEFVIKLPNYLIEEKSDTVNHYIQEDTEKINIEFSDIYY